MNGIVDRLALLPSATVSAVLADGSAVTMQTYTCMVDWFGEMRRLEVVANAGQFPLLGVGLLLGRELKIDYRNSSLLIS